MKRGLFIVFEGVDGSGTSTQAHKLNEKIKKLDKYQDVLETHEPWKNNEIKRKLQEDKDAYLAPLETAELYIGDRTDHSYVLIKPNLDAGVIVLCVRYKMSTYSFQQAQGIDIHRLIKMHNNRGILTPDITFFIDVPREVAEDRTRKRGQLEKFERNSEFVEKAIRNYKELAILSEDNPELLGRVIRIDGNHSIDEVAADIYLEFLKVYQQWISD
jgi:dTMP kinase